MSEFKSKLDSQMAIALKYNPDKDNAPVVIAAGSGHMAQKIIELANKNNVPVYQDNATVSILSKFEVGKEVPPELYQVIADIYGYILRAGHRLQNGLQVVEEEIPPLPETETEDEFIPMNPEIVFRTDQIS